MRIIHAIFQAKCLENPHKYCVVSLRKAQTKKPHGGAFFARVFKIALVRQTPICAQHYQIYKA
jgi:hypothetical protein